MDDESLLLGEPDTPEMIQKRVFSIMQLLAEGQRIEMLTEKEVKDVEATMEKIRKNLHRAKKTMITDDDLLMANMNRLTFQSPNTNIKKPVPSRKPSISSLEELDYEESIVGTSDEDTEKFGILKIGTDSERESIERSASRKKSSNKRNSKNSSSGLKIVAKNRCCPKRESPEVIVISSDSESVMESSPPKRQKIGYEQNIKKEKGGSDGDDEDDEEDNNVSKAQFLKKLSKEEPYLKLRECKQLANVQKTGLTYPLGVTFDKPSETWFITNSPYQSGGPGFAGESKVLKIYTGKSRRREKYTDIEHKLLENPSAITVYKEGHQVAVLCIDKYKQPSIRLVNFKRDDKVTTFCCWKSKELDFDSDARGLARTKGGNLVTTDRPLEMAPRLRLFSNRPSGHVAQKTFNLRDADIPCFIASSNDTIIITDLGTQTVMMITLDDSDWDHVKFEITRLITSIGVNFCAEEMLNNQYFVYVSGAQIDKHGNVIIADAKNHHFKLFKPGMSYVSRISTDFPVPYVSSFHVNQYGECLILSTRETQKIHFAKLTATNRLERHIKSGCGSRIGVKTPLSVKRSSYKNGI